MGPSERERLPGEKVTGVAVGWKKSFGWVKPDFPVDHEKAELRGGKVFVHKSVLEEGMKRLKRRQNVEFYVCVDDNGLCAEECVPLDDGEEDEAKGQAAAGDEEDVDEEQPKGKGRRTRRGKGKGGKGAGKGKGKGAQEESSWKGTIKPMFDKKANVAVKGARKWLRGEQRQAIVAGGETGRKGAKGEGKAGKGGKASRKGEAKGGGKAARKAKGKGKGKAKKVFEPKGDVFQDSRETISKRRVTGVVRKWMGKFGWITPNEPIEHEAAEQHNGEVFVHANDYSGDTRLHRGAVVDFMAYADDGGLGASNVRLREAAPPRDSGDQIVGGHDHGHERGQGGGKSKGKGGGKKGRKGGEGKTMMALPSKGASERPGKGGDKGGKGKHRGVEHAAVAKGGKASGKSSGKSNGKSNGKSGGKSSGKSSGKAASAGKGSSPGPSGVKRTISKAAGKGKQQSKGKRQNAGQGGRHLPANWEEHFSDEHGLVYYWNSKTKESRWVKPE